MMKIGLDCRTVGPSQTGVGRYVWRLASALLRYDDAHAYHLLFRRGVEGIWIQQALQAGAQVSFARFGHEDHPGCDLWEQTVLPLWLRRRGITLFASGIFQIPFWSLSTARLFVVHDMIAFLHPETMPKRFALYVRAQTRIASLRAHGILVNSETTRSDLIRFVPRAARKIHVVYSGLDPEKDVGSDPTRPASLPESVTGPFFLSVGTTEPRKNLAFLVRCYSEAKAQCPTLPPLLLVGQPGEEDDRIRSIICDTGMQEAVIRIGYVPDRELRWLYENAALFLYPSLYEGFGYPPLEAMRSGTPVVASCRGSLKEVVADAGRLLDPGDSRGWQDAMIELWLDRSKCDALRRLGQDRIRHFSPERTASMALDAFMQWVT